VQYDSKVSPNVLNDGAGVLDSVTVGVIVVEGATSVAANGGIVKPSLLSHSFT
jgi:hypothetical protein